MPVRPGQWVLIAANRKSGAGPAHERLCSLREAIIGEGFKVELCESLDRVAARSRELHSAGSLRAIVAAGGDGTAAAVVNCAPVDVPLVIFPLGTENLLARHLGLTADVGRACAALRGGRVRRLDVGLAGDRMFLVMLGVGFDAAVVEKMHAARKGHIRRWSYAKPIWEAVRNYDYPEMEIEIAREEANGDKTPCLERPDENYATGRGVKYTAAWAFAFNLPRYAAGLKFCPQAIDGDGLLDVCTFRRGGFWLGIWYLCNVWLGKHQQLKDFGHFRARKITIRSSRPVPYQLDGDPGGELPVEIEVLPSRLCVLMPIE